MKQIRSGNYEETLAFAKSLAENGTIKAGSFVALYGGLGSGKTAFVNGLVKYFSENKGEPLHAQSPTFAIVNEYPTEPPIFHFDMYRIGDEEELYQTGFYDYFDRGGIIVTEWSENIEYAVPAEAVKIFFEYGTGTDERWITVKNDRKE